MRFSKMAVVSVISTVALLATAGIASATTSAGQGQTVQKPGFNYRMMGNKGKGIGFAGSMSSVMSVVAKDLNISTQTLTSDLSSGKSINDLATAQGVSTTTLAQDVQAAMTADMNQAVQAGKITSAQATTMESNLAQRVQDFLSQTHQARGQRGIGFAGPKSSLMSAVAKDLNISSQTLMSDLGSGKSINDLATAQGVSTTTLAQDMQAAMTADINQAVQAGKITSAQATTMESNLTQRVQNILSQSGHKGGKGGQSGIRGGAFHRM